MGEKGRHRGDDAGAIRTGQGQNELMIGHGADLITIQAAKWSGFAALLYHRKPACANPETGVRMNKSRTISVGARSWLTD
jgi:hypothetical protein